MAGDLFALLELTSRVMRYVDLRGLSEAEQADLHDALTRLALHGTEQDPVLTLASAGEVVRDNPTTEPQRCEASAPGDCGARLMDVAGVTHVCASDTHDTTHACACGTEWDEVVTAQLPESCGVNRDIGAGHHCVCHLESHNTVPGPDLVEVPLHACATCGQPWTV